MTCNTLISKLCSTTALCLIGVVCLAYSQTDNGPGARAESKPPKSSNQLPTASKDEARRLYLLTSYNFLVDGNRVSARTGYLQVTKLDPSYAPAWFNLGVFAEAEQNWILAKSYFSKYQQLAPNGKDASRARSEIELLNKYIAGQISPSSEKAREYDALIQRARAFMANGYFKESISESGKAQALLPSRWEAYAVASLCMAKQHKLEAAVKLQQIAVEHAPVEKREQIQDVLAKKTAEWNP